MARYCKKCNSPIEEGGNFCTQCGSNEIFDDSPEAVMPIEAEPIAANPGLGSPISQITMPATEPTKSSFGDLPDFMGGSSVQEETPTTPATSPSSILPQSTTPLVNDTTPSIEQQLFATNETNEKKSNNKLIFIILGIVGGVLLIAGIITMLLSGNKKIDTTNTTPGRTVTPEEVNKFFTTENSYRVGTPEFGYVSIPNNWVKFVDTNGSDTLQYTDNGSWIVTLFSIPTSTRTAEDWANHVYNKLYENGAINIDSHTTKIDNFEAIELNAFYQSDNIYLSTWFFEDKKGTTHYLALEGPSNTGDYYNIVFSFKKDK